jgi:uncharacterized cupredoxin-like copper-binding protein
MRNLIRVGAVLASLIFALALASCGGDDSGDEQTGTEAASSEGGEPAEEGAEEGGAEVAAGAADSTVSAKLGEYYIKPAESAVDAGNIQFKVNNEGKIEHEFVVIKTDTPPGDLPLVDGDVDEEAAGEVPGEIGSVEPGATEEVTLSLDPGKYALICNLPGHYQAGQYTGFTVR